jgi:hypothetical protein
MRLCADKLRFLAESDKCNTTIIQNAAFKIATFFGILKQYSI